MTPGDGLTMRTRILETIIAALEPVDFVLALWQGGSAQGFWQEMDTLVEKLDRLA